MQPEDYRRLALAGAVRKHAKPTVYEIHCTTTGIAMPNSDRCGNVLQVTAGPLPWALPVEERLYRLVESYRWEVDENGRLYCPTCYAKVMQHQAELDAQYDYAMSRVNPAHYEEETTGRMLHCDSCDAWFVKHEGHECRALGKVTKRA